MTSSNWRFGLIGRDISYSKSPDIFDAIFRQYDTAGSFELIDLEADDLEMRFAELRTGYHGLSVTIPHKQLVPSLVDNLTEEASAVGAVNSIKIRHGKTIGDNTDVVGFLLPLMELQVNLNTGRALVIGNGGSARAVVYALGTTFGMKRITVLGRDSARLEQFRSDLSPHLPADVLDTATAVEPTDEFSLVVNCTPLGGFQHPYRSPFPHSLHLGHQTVYYDLNYNRPNAVVESVRRSERMAIDGALMLVGQAAASFAWWTDSKVDPHAIATDIFPDGNF